MITQEISSSESVGVGIALQFLTPRVTLLAFAVAISGGLLAASRILLGRRDADGRRSQSIQLEPALQAAAARRAAADRTTVPDVLQRALRGYLRAHESAR